MSWKARRFKSKDEHHVPPRHPSLTTPVKIRVNKIDHAAYHQLFQNAGSYEQCCEILYRDWWKPYLELKNANQSHADKTAA